MQNKKKTLTYIIIQATGSKGNCIYNPTSIGRDDVCRSLPTSTWWQTLPMSRKQLHTTLNSTKHQNNPKHIKTSKLTMERNQSKNIHGYPHKNAALGGSSKPQALHRVLEGASSGSHDPAAGEAPSPTPHARRHTPSSQAERTL